MYKQYTYIDNKKVPLIKGGKGGCFPAGTLVSTPVGPIDIKYLRVGDIVHCFTETGLLRVSKIIKKWIHKQSETPDNLLYILHTYGSLQITDNHFVYAEDGSLKEAKHFKIGESLVLQSGKLSKILDVVKLGAVEYVYNLTIDTYHNYIADGIRVSNKGGGKGGGGAASAGVEQPNSLFSTDILFLTVALGEGPIYRINPNGPQDIEINEGSIDSLLNLDTDGLENTDLFKTTSTTGTITQQKLALFGDESVVPQSMSSAVTLKKGNLAGVPRAAVTLQDTSAARFDSIRFHFTCNALQSMTSNGDINPASVSLRVIVYNKLGTETLVSIDRTIDGKTNTSYKFSVDATIPEQKKSSSGYKFTVEKISDDNDSSKLQDSISFSGWDEIINDDFAYPRTALIGYAIKAHGEYTGSVPTITCVIKGLLCKVPANYNQPILETGEIDWRQLEVPDSGDNSYTTKGYRLQKTGSTILYTVNPVIYDGLWDGSFVFSWTQNPIWQVYDLLTNTTYGLGIPESYIDKFRFYKVAQYCDGVDSRTGKYYGVSGYADGTFRYKPLGTYTAVREVLIGLSRGTAIKERRFVCDVNISAQKQVIDLINQITAVFRGILFYSAGKITLNVDIPDELPVAIFNEANIIKDTFSISGIKESDIISGVEVSYIEPGNHFRREMLKIDDPLILSELNQIENVRQIELTGVTRRSQAIRYAQYLIASSKYIRRKCTFKTSTEGLDLTVGNIIGVSQRAIGTSWGYGGALASNSSAGQSNVILEHFTSPALSNTVFTANTKPLALRILHKNSDKIDLYLISNTEFTTKVSGNASTGIDLAEVKVIKAFNPHTKTFSNSGNTFTANTIPIKGDIWTLGEIDPSNYLTATNDKLFKILEINRDGDNLITLSASEYISNVYTDSDTLINYTPVAYKDTVSPMITPPSPSLGLNSRPVRNPDGSIRYDIDVSVYTDLAAYPINIQTEYQYLAPSFTQIIESIQ